MQTTIHVICSAKKSLRELILKDPQLATHLFKEREQKRVGRKPGWAKLDSTETGRQGALNLEWIETSRTLLCRVVHKGKGRPDQMVGDFIAYLLARHRSRIRAICIFPSRKTRSNGNN